MNKQLLETGMTILIILAIAGLFIGMSNHYKQEINTLKEQKAKLYDAWLKAEHKQCCQVIQERHRELILNNMTDSGYEYAWLPQIVSCNDTYDYQGGKIIK